MSYFSDLLHLDRSRKTMLLSGALLIAICAGVLLWYAPKYDNPAVVGRSETASFMLLGRPGTLTITCRCPPYLISQQSRNLTYHFQVALNPVPEPNSKAPAQTTPTEAEVLGVTAYAKGAGVDSKTVFSIRSSLLISKRADEGDWSLDLTPSNQDFSEIVFMLDRYLPSEELETVAQIHWPLPARASFRRVLQPLLYSLLIFLLALILLYSMNRKYRILQEADERRLQVATETAAANPNKAGPEWVLAGANLQRYFTRNLSQVRWVFYVSVGVMGVGFAFVLYGVYEQIALSALDPKHIIPATWVASVSGLITQFIGATFMVIYRSTMSQANEFVTVLDRINTVGIAMKVLDQIPDGDRIKNSARRELIGLLLRSHPRQEGTLGVRRSAKRQPVPRKDHAPDVNETPDG